MTGRTSALHRFFVGADVIADVPVQIEGGLAHQLARVLRVKRGERIILLDGSGMEHVVEVAEATPKLVTGTVREVRPGLGEPRLTIVLYQGVVTREKLETVIQKGTEVGVGTFVPVACERSTGARGDGVDEHRLERWRRIATEAAEQAGRGAAPTVRSTVSFAAGLDEAVAAGPTLVAWEGERERSVRDGLRAALRPSEDGGWAVSGTRRLSLFVGPEGGFSPREAAMAVERGALTVSLGPRILRTETAGPVLAALALYEVGELAPRHPVSST